MSKKKEFSILKWIIFPANSVILAAIIACFNITVFGLRDGLPYSIIVAMIGLFSIVINKYTESENRSLAKAAFVFEIFLTVALVINACYSVSVQRKMSVAKMAEANQKETITEIGKLKGSRTQREALKKIDKPESSQSIFANVEDILFWIMCGELALYGLSAFTLFALAKLIEGDGSKARDDDNPFPKDIDVDVEKRSPSRRENLTTRKDTAKTYMSFDLARAEAGLTKLRDALKDISFRLAGVSFKADPNPNLKECRKSGLAPDHIWIRAMRANQGTQETIHSVKMALDVLNDAITMPRDAFIERLKKFLTRNGFDL